MNIPKTVLYVSFIVLLGLVLRTISAYYVDIGSDEIIYSLIPYNIISAGRLSTVEQAPLYFYLVDIGYKLEGGISLISTRWPSIVFGAFASIVLFLISLELFQNKKAAYLSALLFAVSGYALRWNQEMDMTAYFFSLLSVYFFIVALKRVALKVEGKSYLFYFAAGFLALAALAKPIVLLFIPAYALVGLFHGGKTKSGLFYRDDQESSSPHSKLIHPPKLIYNKNVGKILLIAGLIMILVVMPVLVYNYLLYKEKGMTDYYFTVLAGVGSNSVYAGQEANQWSFSSFLQISKQKLFLEMWRYNPLLLVLGLLGLVLTWKPEKIKDFRGPKNSENFSGKEKAWGKEGKEKALKKEKYGIALLVLTTAFLLLYLAGKMGSPTHYVWIPLVLSIFAGYGLVKVQELVAQKITPKINFPLVLALLLILLTLNTIFILKEILPLRNSSIQNVLHDYAAEHLPDEAIVVLDPRIYRGIYAWAFYDKHYLEGTYFPELTQNLNNLPGAKQELLLYYIECGPGKYCGWKPEDFQRIYDFGEQLSVLFRQKMEKIGELNTLDKFIIYRGSLSVSPSVYDIIDRTHLHWYTPIGWKYPELAVDAYTPATLLDKILNSLGLLILYADVAIALLSLPLVFFLLGRRSG